ncbi:MAG: hypothetical protein HXX08_04725 [Chloroflexi bacterium]|uniref:Uncharacterized protein n=1 Tax=Candidatus Chlorohelix allophototropha TaxID=3003348 RepID=A0A8T7M2C0_9CHLR|nr:hypothetical protein [Chloroflexota bacterium]
MSGNDNNSYLRQAQGKNLVEEVNTDTDFVADIVFFTTFANALGVTLTPTSIF